ncbi:hypothetical protein Metev_2365 (plasmid) [Methanohalobium evestigatum Z-7303]|uniref:Uncharacterized protein n=1 Tax=Methanohalobium evestigatum (strain ATCC BAA-1072 / DSM 3721 / NBRC 107634 / OCM 161 / Z-7303) TaxID=644295 RepID=D7EC53_METEZ|nr:hypothetical protein Metev_2365 [Methanohalobium evestigatum Z-7303]
MVDNKIRTKFFTVLSVITVKSAGLAARNLNTINGNNPALEMVR